MNQSCLLSLIKNKIKGGGLPWVKQLPTPNYNEYYDWKPYLFLCYRRRWPDTMTDTHGKSVPALPKIKRQSNKGKYFVCQLLTTSERRNKGTSTGRYLHHAKGRVNHWSTAIFIKPSDITAVMIRDKNTLKKWQIIYQWEGFFI